jgi:urease gamma subunit
MILIKVQCIGINPPIIKTYFLRDSIDEIIFFNTLNKINTKLKRKLPINLDEARWFYSGYLFNLIKKDIPLDKIKKDNGHILNDDQLMIGVKEFLKEINFEIMIETFKTILRLKNKKFL